MTQVKPVLLLPDIVFRFSMGRPMRRNFTLPELEQELTNLREGAIHRMLRGDYERLFGENDAALGRLRGFAKSHDCVASFADDAILFRRRCRDDRRATLPP
ncbi:hypothetical protein [Bradyrhizobium sp. CCBAU 51627]|uniref:hypothetical protein n=1 Tax=Bradyrhizobium sp. CCBAU 51627 TaxID=1325088 RepID=UPI002306AE19|nr:hypothetical protein [Bradyrhizobium sp. CCBAU 51627]